MKLSVSRNKSFLRRIGHGIKHMKIKRYYVLGINCTPPAIEDFPHDLFDEKQRQGGAVVVHVIVSLYLFIALAVVCDKFFVPAVEKICHGKENFAVISKYIIF